MAPQLGLDHFTRKMGRDFCANLGLSLVRGENIAYNEILS